MQLWFPLVAWRIVYAWLPHSREIETPNSLILYQSTIQDPSTLSGVYEGDLRYGRCLVDVSRPSKDYQAERDENGQAKNKPVFGVPPQRPRDPEVWSKTRAQKRPKKSEVGSGDDLFGEILLMKSLNLHPHMTMIGESISRVSRLKA